MSQTTKSPSLFKIDSSIQFQNFHPGQEYIKRISIQNTSQSNALVVKIKKLPKHSSFFLPGYRPGWKLRIRKGLKEFVDIIFRPVEKIDTLNDEIQFVIYEDGNRDIANPNFTTKTGITSSRFNNTLNTNVSAQSNLNSTFNSTLNLTGRTRDRQREIFTHTVKLSALVPNLKFHLSPSEIDFGFCAVRDEKTSQISIQRRSVHDDDLPSKVSFHWYTENENLFSITPKTGELIGDSKKNFTVTFRPQEAISVEATAVCCINGEENPSIILKMNGIGKYSFLTISETCIDFSSVLAGQSLTKSFEIYNKSLVGTNFSIHHTQRKSHQSNEESENTVKETNILSLLPSSFSFKPSSGYIDAEGIQTIQVTYSPATNDLVDSEVFEIRSLDLNITNKRMIQCIGKSFGPKISVVGSNIFNFGQLKVGQKSQQVLQLRNDSPLSVEIEIIDGQENDCTSSTSQGTPVEFKTTRAIIPPNSNIKIPVIFSLNSPVNYYNRYYIAVRNQNLLYIDILGNGFTDDETPAPLSIKHVFAYKERCHAGLDLITPEEFDAIINKEESERTKDEINLLSKFENSLSDYRTYTLYDQVIQEFLSGSANRNLNTPVSLDVSSISFGRTTSSKLSNQLQVVRVKNHTNSKIFCRPFVGKINQGKTNSPFLVFPEEGQDILPKSSVEFKIAFRPENSNAFYSQNAQFVCIYKVQRSFRLINEKSITPPFNLLLKLSGHTFSDSGSLALKAYLSPSRVVTFPSLLVHETASQTIVLRNSSDIPLPFSIDFTSESTKSSLDAQGIFSVYPSEGQVNPNDFKLITFRFKPKKSQAYHCIASFTFNMSQQSKKLLTLIGNGCIPQIDTPQTTILLKPTHKGNITRRTFELTNPSQIPASVRITTSNDISRFLTISPKSATIQPNSNFTFEAVFAPQQIGSYKANVLCEVVTEGLTPSETPNPINLTFLGEVAKSTCEVEPKQFNFGNIRVGESSTSQITLLNSGDVDLPYELKFFNHDENDDLVPEESNDIKCTDEKLKKGIISARSYIIVPVIYKPIERRYSRVSSFCCLPLESDDDHQENKFANTIYTLDQLLRFPSCDFEGVGCIPQLGITDIYSSSIPKNDLWEQFSISSINNELAALPKSLAPSAKEIAYHNFIKYLPHFFLNFGSKTIGRDETSVYIQFENIGKIEAEFSLMFSNDSIIEIDRWAQNGDQRTEEQERELFIILNEIFTVSPKHGILKPGERTTIKLSYQHKLAEVHSVPLWMKVHNGGSNIVFDLSGRTLNIDQVSLQFTSMQHQFKPVVVGAYNPPIQYYPLKNCSDVETRYTVDMSTLDDFSEENHGYTIIDLENPQGKIPAGGVTLLRFIFNPMEVKDYNLEIPISIQNDDTYFVQFSGSGIKDISDNQDTQASQQDVEQSQTEYPGYIKRLNHEAPSAQTIYYPDQNIRFSMNIINFGEIPTFSSNRRLLILNNISNEESLHFKWNIELPATERGQPSKLTIEPSQGIVEPGQSALCQVDFNAGSVPEYLNVDIDCIILSESERTQRALYNEALEKSINNIGDNDTASKASEQYTQRPRISLVERSLRETNLKSLNFISYHSNPESYGNEYIMETNPILNRSKRTSPLFHEKIRIIAHVTEIELYQNLYPEQYYKQNIPSIQEHQRELLNSETNNSIIKQQIDLIGKDFVLDFMEGLLQNIIKHKDVKDTATFVVQTKAPYYSEFADVKPIVSKETLSNDELESQLYQETQDKEDNLENQDLSHQEDSEENDQQDDTYYNDDSKSESSHLDSIDLAEHIGGHNTRQESYSGSHSRPVLDYQEEVDDSFDENEKRKQYEYNMAQEDYERKLESNLNYLPATSIQQPSIQSNNENISANPQDTFTSKNFQDMLKWVLDETMISICTELMEN